MIYGEQAFHGTSRVSTGNNLSYAILVSSFWALPAGPQNRGWALPAEALAKVDYPWEMDLFEKIFQCTPHYEEDLKLIILSRFYLSNGNEVCSTFIF